MMASAMVNSVQRKGLLPWVALFGGLLLTFVAARGVIMWDDWKQRANFDIVVDRTRELFQQQIDKHLVLLDGMRGLVHAKLSLDREQFRAYVNQLQLDQRYPGVQGLGFASLVVRERQDQALANIRERTDASFVIWPESNRDRRCPIVYFEPATTENARVIGYDLFDQDDVRVMLDRAAATAQSGAYLNFVSPAEKSDPSKRTLIMAAPAYFGGETPATSRERLDLVFGFLFCAFRLDVMLAAIPGVTTHSELAYTIFAGEVDRAEGDLNREVLRSVATAPNPKFIATTALTIAGRPWRVEFAAGEKPAGLWRYGLHPWWLLGGSALSLALFAAGLALTRARRSALANAEARRDAEARFQRLVEQSIVGIYVIQDDRFTYVNPRMAEIFGCSQSELLEKPLLHFIAEESRALTRQNVQRRLSGEVESVHYILRAVRKDGQVIDVEAHGGRVDYNGRPGILGCLLDITERAEAGKKLEAQLARLHLLSRTTRAIAERQDLQSIFQVALRSLEDHLPIDFGCICLRDADHDTLTVTTIGVKNAHLIETLALTPAPIDAEENGLEACMRGDLLYFADLKGSNAPFLHELWKAGLGSAVLAPMAVNNTVFGIVVAARLETDSFPSPDREFLRQLSEHVALATHQAQLYGALEDAYNDLRATREAAMQQERLRAIGQMASGIAHDINNAIMPVSVYAELLLAEEPGLSAQAREYLQVIQQSSSDVAATVSRLREVYHPRQAAAELRPVDLNRQVQHVLELTKPRWHIMAQGRGITIKVDCALTLNLPAIDGVESEIREALTNLVLNAVDAMPNGGTLSLRTSSPPAEEAATAAKMVQLEVADTGCGMDEETQQRCLEPFFTTKGERGTGLGLAMVFGIIERHSGTIEIDSAPGKGTTFRLIFPAATGAAEASPEEMPSSAQAQLLRILLVDDDPVLLKSLQTVLEGDGHFVVAKSSGQAAIDAFAAAERDQAPFSLVITDLGMPRVDGRMVVAAVKRASPATPVILLTGWGQRLVATGDIPLGVSRVLSKPANLHELREALLACTGPQAGNELRGSPGFQPS